jgi:AGZA family xanthine/uracil permease-like MFS transporter
VRLNPHITEPRVLIFFAGLIITAVLHARKVRGAILWGILISTGIALVSGQQGWEGVVGLPRQQAFFQFDFSWMRRPETYFTILPYVLIFLFMNVFDTVGTLIGVSEQAGFLVDNKLPRASQALLSDAVATVAGACMGTSTVTSYIESAVGVASGGRTGLASIVTGGLFIVALFFTPLAKMVGGYPSITAPALLIVGGMMVRNLEKVDWEDYTEALPAFLIILGVPLFYSISDGLAVGFISYPLIKLLSGKGKGISPVVYVIAVLFIARYVFFPV